MPTPFKPFQLNRFLAIESESELVRVEDLKITQRTKNTARAAVNIKNVSEYKIQVGVHLALFDANLRLIGCGNYITTPLFGGYKARETSTETISLGNVGDISKAKYYQTRVVAYIDQ